MYLEPLNTVYSYELKSRIIHRCVFLLQCDFEICANLILRNLPKELISMQQSQLPGHETPSSTFATPQTTATMPPPPSSSQSTSVPSSQTTSSLASSSSSMASSPTTSNGFDAITSRLQPEMTKDSFSILVS